MKKPTLRQLSIAILAGLALAAILLIGVWLSPLVIGPTGGGAPVRTSGEALIGGPFELTDQAGRPVRDTDFRGRYMLVFFGFTYCPDVCPIALQVMGAALDRLEQRVGAQAMQVAPLFITIDPEHDTPDIVAAYLGHFHPRLVGLTGSPAQISQVAEAYRIYYRKAGNQAAAAGYTMDHSAAVYLMGPDGRFLAHFAPGTSPEAMVDKIENFLDG